MTKVMVINGSPRMEKGNTALLQEPFIQGMQSQGAEVELFYLSRLDIKPCSCGRMACWNKTPGECCIEDDMNLLYPALRAAQVLVLATPVYSPLPGAMANFINRLCPLIEPDLVFRRGRTRARARAGVEIQTIALVCVSGWWEKANCATVARVASEMAEDLSVGFGGALLRPHSSYLRKGGVVTPRGQAVLDAARQAGAELVRDGVMDPLTLRQAGKALVTRREWFG